MQRATWGGIGLSGALALLLTMGGCPDGGAGTGGVFNLAPTAVITVDLVRGVAPLRVSFSSNRSTDDGLIVEREWDFGDGTTSPEVSPTHTYETTGTFTVRLTLVDDDGATSSTTTTIRVTRAPIARISVNATELPTAPGRLLFDATASTDPDGTIVAYLWDFGDGSRESLAEVSHSFASSGTFNVTLTVTDNVGITGRDEVVIRVGIRQPEIEFRLPPEDAALIVIPQDSAIWVEGVFQVEPGVPRRIIAGLDRDQDLCDAKGLLLPVDTLETSVEYLGHINFVTDIGITPDGESVVTTSLDGSARIYNPISAALVTRIDAGVELNAGTISPDGTQLAVAQADGVASVRDLESGGIAADLIGHVGAVNDVAWSSDGAQIISAGEDQRALLWGMPDGQLLATIPHNSEVTAAGASPTNPDQLVTGELNGDVNIWNRSGDLVRVLSGHGGQVDDLAVSIDGAILASASADGTVILWDIDTGLRLITLSGHEDGATAVAFSNDLSRVFTGDGAGTIRVFDLETGTVIVESAPCVSPVSGLTASPTDAGEFLAGIAAGTGIALDTVPPNGGDLNFTQPQALHLSDVPSLSGDAVPLGDYLVFAEVSTDRSSPSRAYSGAQVRVIEALPDSFNADVPVLPLDDDEAMLVVDADTDRQIIDLGPAGVDDEVVVTLLSQPGYADRFDAPSEFSVMLLDENQEIFAWFQRKDGVTPVLFDRSTRLTFARDLPNLFAVVDGGVSLHVTFQRGVGDFGPNGQRVYVNFEGAEVGVGGRPKQIIQPLDVTSFGQFFDAANSYGDAENQLLRDAIRQTITDAYVGFDVTFTFSDQSGPPAAPFSTIYFGGQDPDNVSLGVSDFVDPRNATAFGAALVYASETAEFMTNSGVDDPVVDGDTPNTACTKWGNAIGQVAAHHIGHLLGLRHTSNSVDLMFGALNEAIVDPTIPRALGVGTVSQSEQFNNLPALGTQDAPQQLTDTVGTP